jgi:hypothetical protein
MSHKHHGKPELLKKEKNALERAILGHYERLNQANADGANESAYADIQDHVREKEQRVSEIVDEITAVSILLIDEPYVRDAIGRFEVVGQPYHQPSEPKPSTRSSTRYVTTVTARNYRSPTTLSVSGHSTKYNKVKRVPPNAKRQAQTGVQIRQANRKDDRRSRNAARAAHIRPITSHHQDGGPRHPSRSPH